MPPLQMRNKVATAVTQAKRLSHAVDLAESVISQINRGLQRHKIPGSARVSRAGDHLLAIANFLGRLFWRDAKTRTRDAHATRNGAFIRRDLVKARARACS